MLTKVVHENWVKFKVKYSAIETTLTQLTILKGLVIFLNTDCDRYVSSAELALIGPLNSEILSNFEL